MLGLVLAVGLGRFMPSSNSCGVTCSVSVEACYRMDGGLVVSIGTFFGFLSGRGELGGAGDAGSICWCMGVFLKRICNSRNSPLTYINFN